RRARAGSSAGNSTSRIGDATLPQYPRSCWSVPPNPPPGGSGGSPGSMMVAGSPRSGPPHVRLPSPARAGGESHEEDQAHAPAGDPKAPERGGDARGGQGARRGLQDP